MQKLLLAGLVSALPFVAACGAETSQALEPASGVTLPLEMPEVLEAFAGKYDPETWLKKQAEVGREGIMSGLGHLDEAGREAALEGLIEAQLLMLIDRDSSNHMVVVTLMQWDSPDSARAYVQVEREAMAAKDKGQGVEGAEYREVAAEDLSGFISDKNLRDMFGPYGAHSCVVARDRMVVEVTVLAEDKADAELIEEARGLLGALGVPAP